VGAWRERAPVIAALSGSIALAGTAAAPAGDAASIVASPEFFALADPAAGSTVNAEVVEGTVRFKRPSAKRFEALGAPAQIPVGSEIDTTRGWIRIEAAQDLRGNDAITELWAGRFKLTQRRAQRPVTVLTPTGGDLARCPDTTGRELWGRGKGRYRIRGRYSVTSVVGTTWTVQDRCDGTLTSVIAGRVEVEDVPAHRTTTVRAGHSYLAHAPR
jgi:hypothetical protein